MSGRSYSKPCKFECGQTVVWQGKTGQPNSTGFFEIDTKAEHTYERCRKIKSGEIQVKTVPQIPKEQTTLPTTSNNGQIPVSLNSLLNKLTTIERKQEDLDKQFDTLAQIIDKMYQNIELLVAKIGIPGPKPASNMTKYDPPMWHCETCGQDYADYDAKHHDICHGCLTFGKPTRIDGDGTKHYASISNDSNEEEIPSLKSTNLKNLKWESINERFLCDECSVEVYHGLKSQGSGKLCPNCAANFEANQAYDEMQ